MCPRMQRASCASVLQRMCILKIAQVLEGWCRCRSDRVGVWGSLARQPVRHCLRLVFPLPSWGLRQRRSLRLLRVAVKYFRVGDGTTLDAQVRVCSPLCRSEPDGLHLMSLYCAHSITLLRAKP